MALLSVTVELPEEIVLLLGEDQPAPDEAREAVILSLLRKAKISQGKAAELLGKSKWEMDSLLEEYGVYSGPETPEEIAEEIETARRIARSR